VYEDISLDYWILWRPTLCGMATHGLRTPISCRRLPPSAKIYRVHLSNFGNSTVGRSNSQTLSLYAFSLHIYKLNSLCKLTTNIWVYCLSFTWSFYVIASWTAWPWRSVSETSLTLLVERAWYSRRHEFVLIPLW